LVGGAGAGKSYAVALKIIEKFYTERNKRFLITRKTLPSLKITAYRLILDLLQMYGFYYALNKSELIITNDRGNEILFKSLDEPEKIRSYDANYIWVEEATDLTAKDHTHLRLCLRRETDVDTPNQMFFSFNPVSVLHFLHKEYVENFDEQTMVIMYSNWKDNPFLDDAYIEDLEGLKDKDKMLYRIYTEGLWGTLENVIFSNYTIESVWPTSFDEVIYGLDFGFNHPTALIEIGFKDGVPYERELLYKTKLTNTDLIKEMNLLGISKTAYIFGDSQEPARIEEIADAGYNIHPAKKGAGSVKSGLDLLRSVPSIVYSGSINLIKELQSYKYKEDKNGNAFEEPVKFRDDLMDARRYARWTYKENILGVGEGDVYVR